MRTFDAMLKLAGKAAIYIFAIGLFLNMMTGGSLVSSLRRGFGAQSHGADLPGSQIYPATSGRNLIRLTVTPDNFLEQPWLVQLGIGLVFVGILLLVMSHIVTLLSAMRISTSWVVVCFFFPLASPVFALLHFYDTRLPLVGFITGFILTVFGYGIVSLHF